MRGSRSRENKNFLNLHSKNYWKFTVPNPPPRINFPYELRWSIWKIINLKYLQINTNKISLKSIRWEIYIIRTLSYLSYYNGALYISSIKNNNFYIRIKVSRHLVNDSSPKLPKRMVFATHWWKIQKQN